MHVLVARTLAVSIGIGLGCIVACFVPNNPAHDSYWSVREWLFPSPETRLWKEGDAHRQRILAEIARSPEIGFAGVYRSTGRFVRHELTIAPHAGFTLYSDSMRCGTCDGYRQIGRVIAAESDTWKLQIDVAGDLGKLMLDDTLHWVPWGELLFAVPQGQMETFCADFADGYTFPDFPYRKLRTPPEIDAKEALRPAAAPDIPSAFQHLIPRAPITCRLVALTEWNSRLTPHPLPPQEHDARYTVDAGSDQGLAVGMRLYVSAIAPYLHPEVLRVDEMSRDTSRVSKTFWLPREHALELVDRQASTLHPDAPRN